MPITLGFFVAATPPPASRCAPTGCGARLSQTPPIRRYPVRSLVSAPSHTSDLPTETRAVPHLPAGSASVRFFALPLDGHTLILHEGSACLRRFFFFAKVGVEHVGSEFPPSFSVPCAVFHLGVAVLRLRVPPTQPRARGSAAARGRGMTLVGRRTMQAQDVMTTKVVAGRRIRRSPRSRSRSSSGRSAACRQCPRSGAFWGSSARAT